VVTKAPTILYAGTYERTYPRNQQLIRLLRSNGCEVVEIHQPFWETISDKSRSFRGKVAVLFAAFNLLTAYLRLVFRFLTRIQQADAIAVGYIGQIDMLTIGVLGRLFRRPVIFNPLVTLTDTVVDDRRLVAEGSAIARLVWLIDWVALRLASVVISDTWENASFIEQRFGISRSRIQVLHVGADEGVFQHTWQNRREGGRLSVLFYGKMIPLHGVETILTAIERLDSECPETFRFELIGSGQEQEHVIEFLRNHPESGLVYRPYVAYPRLAQRIATSDVVLGIFGTGDKAGRVVPNKVFQAMAVGAPIVTRDSPAIREVLDDESAMLIAPGDPDALCNAMRELLDPDRRESLGRNAREAFEQYGSDETLREAVRSTIEDQLQIGRTA
jgi:glycosyltransferase involved in cell wall biosynthesis